MELRQLEYFQMASRLGSITRAAERLHVSQPSITKAIQKLEGELNVQLFDRSQKHLALTPEGAVFLERIEKALHMIDDALFELKDYQQLQKGAIKIGIPPMVGSYLFPKIFYHFRKQYPKLETFISEEGSLMIRDKLEKGELDLGIAIINETPSNLQTIPLAVHQILVCMPPNHPLSQKESLSVYDLDQEPLIMLKEDSYHRRVIAEKFSKASIVPQIVLSSSQVETIKGLVVSGTGISFLLDVIAQKEPLLVTRPFSEPLQVQVGLVWKKEGYLSRASRAFMDFMQQYI
ncbi:MAG: LysR family transcriptional regulator [Sporomusaceae bacterium]|nr:LysR family transcriptional regulator [Sporomusaceae bacterium]